MLLMIDNYDSFTFNLVQYFGELGEEVLVKRNDEISIADIEGLAPHRIVISPGPGSPIDAGVSVPAVEAFGGRIPILGVCLGHQAIGQAFGGRVVHAKTLMHGKTSQVTHNGSGVFADLPSPYR
ncbi:MAG: aminodeoxychorismate/anthranilate synthase component II, partial [Usitatibacteraceae bacterium]